MNPVAPGGPAIGSVPIEFILFALVLIGVALFHHHTLRIALTGAIVIALYKVGFAPFKTGAGLAGLGGRAVPRHPHLDRRLCRLVLGAGQGRNLPHRHHPVLSADLRSDPGGDPLGRLYPQARQFADFEADIDGSHEASE